MSNFIENLKALQPSREILLTYNLPADYINELMKNFECQVKKQIRRNIISDDVILNLLNQFDCSTIQIGLITLSQEAIEKEDYYLLGHVELDLLSLNKITKEIEVRDHDDNSHIIWKCASSSLKFLNALLVCAESFSKRIENVSLSDDEVFISKTIIACTRTAGGENYKRFYKMLFG